MLFCSTEQTNTPDDDDEDDYDDSTETYLSV